MTLKMTALPFYMYKNYFLDRYFHVCDDKFRTGGNRGRGGGGDIGKKEGGKTQGNGY